MEEFKVAISDPGEIGRKDQNRGDRIIVHLSNLVAWLFPILMVAICAQVVLRQMGHNQAWLDDLQWWLYGVAVLIGIAYAVTTGSHVRVDIFYDNFAKKKRLIIDIIALVWLFFPFVLLCWDVTLDYALTSIAADEGSSSPNGLHNLWILKTLMNLSFIVIMVAIWSAYVRHLSQLTRPALWKQLLFALPSTVFGIQLIIWYACVGWLMATDPEVDSIRTATRAAIFDDLAFGPWEMKKTIALALVATLIVIVVARLLARKER